MQNSSVHYEYWERSAEGKPLRKTIERDEYVDATNDKDLFTQISRKFKIRIPFFENIEKVCTFIESRMKTVNNAEKLLNESMSNKYTGKHKMICRYKLYTQK